MQEYPDYRAGSPPEFLSNKYGNTEDFFWQNLEYADVDIIDADVDLLTTEYPDFSSLFDTTGEQLEHVLERAINPHTDEVISELRITIERHLIFEDVEKVRENAVTEVLKPKFEDLPRELDDLVRGSSPGDVIDPFLVALNKQVLTSGGTKELVRNILVHKCLMKFEDLMGHLHEHVLGNAGGCEWIPEPAGENKHQYDPDTNPYAGADSRRDEREFFELKNKTGSAKGSAGENIGSKMSKLGEVYPGSERFYASVIGDTLKGHRSKGAAEREDPGLEVIVGLQTIQKIGKYRNTPRVLLEFYLELFQEVAEEDNFDIDDIVNSITEEWKQKYGEEDPIEGILYWSIVGDPRQQTNEEYDPYREEVSPESDQTTLEEYAPDLD